MCGSCQNNVSLPRCVCFSFAYMQILIDEGINELNERVNYFIILVGDWLMCTYLSGNIKFYKPDNFENLSMLTLYSGSQFPVV